MILADLTLSDGALSVVGILLATLVSALVVMWRQILSQHQDALGTARADVAFLRESLSKCLATRCSCQDSHADEADEADEADPNGDDPTW